MVELDKKELRRAARVAKWRERKERLKQKVSDGMYWISTHREETLAIAAATTAVAGLGTKVVKGHNKKKALQEEKDLKELYVYDRRLGHYWKVRRKLSNEEWVVIDRRQRDGERLADILTDLRLL